MREFVIIFRIISLILFIGGLGGVYLFITQYGIFIDTFNVYMTIMAFIGSVSWYYWSNKLHRND